jgi:predicted extracellular nuclease
LQPFYPQANGKGVEREMKDSTIRIALLGPAVAALLACGSVNPLEASLDRPGQARSASSPAGVDRDADDDGASAIEATIMEIQGQGAASPLAGELVRTTGVVTLETASAGSFWMQDSQGDGDPSTSDGIYVYQGNYITEVKAGDLVEVTAFVKEYTASGAPASLPLTELVSARKIEVLASGEPPPAPVPLEALPDFCVPEAIAFWEALEGMLVSVDHGVVVAPTSSYGEFCLLTDQNARPGSGYQPLSGQIFIRQIGPGAVDYNPERILVDDASLQEPLIVYPGDRVEHLVGVVDYSFGNYKLQPAQWELQARRNGEGGIPLRRERPADRGPAWIPGRSSEWNPGRGGEVVVATFNVENLFDLENEPGKDDEGSTPTPEQLEVKLSKLRLAILEELELPELLVVQEVENRQILQTLGDRVNAAAGTSYTAVSFESSDVRGIEVGFLYDAQAVTLLDAYRMSGPDVERAFGSSSPSPGREPLVGVFDIAGLQLTVVGNHFKSKAGDEPLFGLDWPPERPTELQRKAQARVVRAFVNGLLEADPGALVVVAGDLNDFQFAEPGEGVDHPLGILQGLHEEVRLANVIDSILPPLRFTYVYEGNSQVLDYLLISPAVKRLFAGADILHFNASYPSSLSADPNRASQCSDHDPVELRLLCHHGRAVGVIPGKNAQKEL